MCGRARCTLSVDDVGRACGFSRPLRFLPDCERFRPSYNMSPGRYMPVVRYVQVPGDSCENSREPVVHCMKWGLIPSFTKKSEKPDHFRMFNARSESVHLKSSFRRLLPRNRCLAIVEGFYEWKKDGAKKQPYYVHFKGGRPLVFAGLYDSWKNEEGNSLYTFTILTTSSSKALNWLHDRMPVILPNQVAIHSWLNDYFHEDSQRHKLTQPYDGSDLVWYPVTSAIGKPLFDSQECIKAIKPNVFTESRIAQLLGKRHAEKDSNSICKDDPDIKSQSIIEDEMPSPYSAEQNEDLSSVGERKALLAGMEPDKDIRRTLKDSRTVGGTESDMNEVDVRDQEGSKISVLRAPQNYGKQENGRKREPEFHGKLESSSVISGGKDSSVAFKKQRLSGPHNAFSKKKEDELLKDKQSTLLSFFGKERI